MILLLDAHVVLWALGEPERLAPGVAESLASPANDVLVSVGSIWEIDIKRALGKLRIERDLLAALDGARMDIVSITGPDAVAAARLPAHHRDRPVAGIACLLPLQARRTWYGEQVLEARLIRPGDVAVERDRPSGHDLAHVTVLLGR